MRRRALRALLCAPPRWTQAVVLVSIDAAADKGPMPHTIELFSFRFRDPLIGKWIRARYLAERHELEQRYSE